MKNRSTPQADGEPYDLVIVGSGAAGLTAGDIISHNYFSWIAVGSMLLLTFTGFDRYIPLFKIPSEPDVYLKSQAAQYSK